MGHIVGDLPSPTFIDRLISGLINSGVDITLYGTKQKGYRLNPKIKVSGHKDGYKEGRNSRFIRLVKYDFLLTVFRNKEKKKLDNWIQKNGYKHWHFKSQFYPILWDSPDVLHVQWTKAIAHYTWVQEFRMKLVVSFRGAHINYSPYSIPGLKEMYKKVLPNVDGYHGVSKAICEEASKYGADIKKCQIAYSGFNISEFTKADWINNFETLEDRSINIVSIGRSHWKKGYSFALDAMRQLKDKNIDFKYTIIGAANNEELLFQRNQLDLEQEVVFKNNVPFNEVKQIIRKADVLLLPSVEEGIANVVLEAMLLGTLVLTTNCGGMEEVVVNNENGFIVPVRNPEAIAETLIKITGTKAKELNRLIENAYETVANQHSEEKMVEDMKALYSHVLKDA